MNIKKYVPRTEKEYRPRGDLWPPRGSLGSGDCWRQVMFIGQVMTFSCSFEHSLYMIVRTTLWIKYFMLTLLVTKQALDDMKDSEARSF